MNKPRAANAPFKPPARINNNNTPAKSDEKQKQPTVAKKEEPKKDAKASVKKDDKKQAKQEEPSKPKKSAKAAAAPKPQKTKKKEASDDENDVEIEEISDDSSDEDKEFDSLANSATKPTAAKNSKSRSAASKQKLEENSPEEKSAKAAKASKSVDAPKDEKVATPAKSASAAPASSSKHTSALEKEPSSPSLIAVPIVQEKQQQQLDKIIISTTLCNEDETRLVMQLLEKFPNQIEYRPTDLNNITHLIYGANDNSRQVTAKTLTAHCFGARIVNKKWLSATLKKNTLAKEANAAEDEFLVELFAPKAAVDRRSIFKDQKIYMAGSMIFGKDILEMVRIFFLMFFNFCNLTSIQLFKKIKNNYKSITL